MEGVEHMGAPLRQSRAWTKTWRAPEGTECEVHLELDEVRVQHFRNLNRSVGEMAGWPGATMDDMYPSGYGREDVPRLSVLRSNLVSSINGFLEAHRA